MLPLYNVLDYIQAIAPYFIERFCHCNSNQFLCRFKELMLSKLTRTWIQKNMRGAANITTFCGIKNFLFTVFLARNTIQFKDKKFDEAMRSRLHNNRLHEVESDSSGSRCSATGLAATT